MRIAFYVNEYRAILRAMTIIANRHYFFIQYDQNMVLFHPFLSKLHYFLD